jgi:uncharacterized membrane protein (DUF2068 family)
MGRENGDSRPVGFRAAHPAEYNPAMPERRSALLTLIAITKLTKAALLIAVGFGAHHLLRGDVQETVLHWEHAVRVDPDNRYAQALLTRVTGLSHKRLEEIGLATLLYGTLFLVEGIGLLMMKRWAEYVTIISTAGFLPLEIYEIVVRFRTAKLVVLLINAAIVFYLVMRLRKTRPATTAS